MLGVAVGFAATTCDSVRNGYDATRRSQSTQLSRDASTMSIGTLVPAKIGTPHIISGSVVIKSRRRTVPAYIFSAAASVKFPLVVIADRYTSCATVSTGTGTGAGAGAGAGRRGLRDFVIVSSQ